MKNEKTQAIALRYDGTSAPRVTAKGEGLIAQQIIAIGKEHSISLEQNVELTALLSRLHVNDEIPRELYTAVAQILAFLYYMEHHKDEE